YFFQLVNLTSSWASYGFDFTVSEPASVTGSLNLQLGTTSSFLLDDVSVRQTDGSPANTTAFRDAIVDALNAYHPGILRYWGDQLGESLDNQIAPYFGRKAGGYTAFSTTVDTFQIGLHEFLELAEAIG